jgi:hypothetical protein
MTEQTHPDWLLIEAGKRSGWATKETCIETLRVYDGNLVFRALCNALWKLHEAGLLPAPVDRKLLCAREAVKEWEDGELLPVTDVSIRAIELWEEGFGK